MMNWYDGHMTVGGWWMMTVVIVLLVALLAATITLVVRAGRRPSEQPTSPQALLDVRLARGEIDLEEYRARRDLLEGRRNKEQ